MTWTRYEIPGWGVGEIGVADGRLVEHSLPRPDAARPDRGGSEPLLERVASYFAGEPVDFADVELFPFERTEFEEDVLAAARRIPWGETVSYGELAALAGHPGAASSP